MSAIAGRVLLIPKGAYNAITLYAMLDVVSYNGNSYVAKKSTQGNTPSADNEFWMLLASGNVIASINDIGDVLITSPTNGQVLKYNATTQKWENGEDTGGLLPHLIIISEDGESEVKAVKGSTEIIATRTSAGHYECDVPEFGTWTIHAVLNGDDATVNLVVDAVKVYTVDDSHFHADITVTYPSGGTCSCSKSGETTLYATGSPYTFTVHSAGAWAITATAYEKTFTQTVNVSSTGQTAYILVPNGATVTPTDDVQILLACAGIGDSQITTLAELLADTTALSAVINSTNAVDYMVRSTTWATIITVPAMTGYTTPSGQVTASTYSTDSDYLPWKAFAQLSNQNGWVPGTSDTVGAAYIQYEFADSKPVAVTKLEIKKNDGSTGRTYKYKFSGSNDGINFTDIATDITLLSNESKTIVLNNTAEYIYHRVYLTYANGGTDASIGRGVTLQFYSSSIPSDSTAMSYIGLNNYCANTLLADSTWCEAICNSEYFESVLNVKVPVMTGATTPSGEVFSNGQESSDRVAWKAFDNDISTRYISPNRQLIADYIIGYAFDTVTRIYMAEFYGGGSGQWTLGIYSGDSQSSLTGVSDTQTTKFGNETYKYILNDNSAKTHYAMKCTASTKPDMNHDSDYGFSVYTLQFYGREDV